MEQRLAAFFGFEAAGTSLRREVLAGVTTFVTMAYIVAVNPAILKAAGIPEGPSMVTTVMTAMFGTLVMGLYANRPFAIAPYMGENAFVAYTVVRVLGWRWQTALGAVFIAGVLFTLLTVARVRQWMTEAVPPGLRFSPHYGGRAMLAGSAKVALSQDDFVFMRPTESEGVFLQFGDIAVYDGQEISAWWPTFRIHA